MEEIKTCPFCGGEAELSEGDREYFEMHLIYCMKCGVNTGNCNSEEEAIFIWNTRV